MTMNASTRISTPVALAGRPPLTETAFSFLKAAGATHFALFGGSIRDADYAVRHKQPRAIKDYDLRIWLPAENYDAHLKSFIAKLASVSDMAIEEMPSAGTGRIRYGLNLKGAELDISVRPIHNLSSLPLSAVAKDRAEDSDIGICSVAIDATGQAYATPEYLADQNNKTLSVYPNDDRDRISAYTARMQQKFPDHLIVWLGNKPAPDAAPGIGI